MVLLNRIYTRGGDKGKTSLGDGSRLAKSSLRIHAIGEVDEVNACMGMVRLYTKKDVSIDQALSQIQNDLFDLGADLCVPTQEDHLQEGLRIIPYQIEWLEGQIDHLNEDLAPLKSFVLPGGCPAAAYLHMARTVARRAERAVVELDAHELINPQVLCYLNRLSDYLFVLSRYLNKQQNGDVLWVPGQNRG